jgi:hypothetical protein
MKKGLPRLTSSRLSGSSLGSSPQENLQKLVRTLGRERVETELAVVGLAAPAVLVLGPVADEKEDPGRGQTLDEGLRLGINPVQVLEDHEHWLRLAFPEQDALDGFEGALPALGGIERLPAGVLDGHIEQGQQGGQGRLEDAIQREELASHLVANFAVSVAILHLEVGLDQIDDGQVARRLAV